MRGIFFFVFSLVVASAQQQVTMVWSDTASCPVLRSFLADSFTSAKIALVCVFPSLSPTQRDFHQKCLPLHDWLNEVLFHPSDETDIFIFDE